MEVCNTVDGASNQLCKAGPDYVCNCCNRLMYRKTVTEFSHEKYHKVPTNIIDAMATHSPSYHTTNDKFWICPTCDTTVKRGLVPVQSKVNSLQLQTITKELTDLNPLETRLICLYHSWTWLPSKLASKDVFMDLKNVPTDLSSVLPRLPSQSQILPMKLKQKLQYHGYYMVQGTQSTLY